jgi:hypothetical protein
VLESGGKQQRKHNTVEQVCAPANTDVDNIVEDTSDRQRSGGELEFSVACGRWWRIDRNLVAISNNASTETPIPHQMVTVRTYAGENRPTAKIAPKTVIPSPINSGGRLTNRNDSGVLTLIVSATKIRVSRDPVVAIPTRRIASNASTV